MTQSLERLFLHVGLPKTATTSMQTWLKTHRPKMRRLGVWNPPFPHTKRGKHAFALPEIHEASTFPFLTRVINESPVPNAILSHEGFSNQIPNISDEKFGAFRNKTRDIQKTIIFVTRNPDSWSKSFYKQCILGKQQRKEPWRGTSMSLQEFRKLEHIQLLMDPERLIPIMMKQYGATEIVHESLENKDWFPNILDQIGLGELKHLQLPNVNLTVPEWIMDLMLRINQRFSDDAQRTAWLALIQRFDKTKHGRMMAAERSSTGKAISALDLDFITELRADKGSQLNDKHGDILKAFEAFARKQ